MNNYILYWIKDASHVDPFVDGYIGITSKGKDVRFNQHKKNRKNKYLQNRCAKEDVEISVLFENLSIEDAKILEAKYRPRECVGWNINKGGDIPPSRKNKVSPGTLLKGSNRTDRQKTAALEHSKRMTGRVSPKKGKKVVRYNNCHYCKIQFQIKSHNTKYCSKKCAALERAQNPNYIEGLKIRTKQMWKTKSKEEMSLLIKQGIQKGGK